MLLKDGLGGPRDVPGDRDEIEIWNCARRINVARPSCDYAQRIRRHRRGRKEVSKPIRQGISAPRAWQSCSRSHERNWARGLAIFQEMRRERWQYGGER